MSFPASAPDAGFLRTLAADPASPAAWTGLGDARRERGLWVAAVVAAERAVRLAPQDGTALTALALARLAAQDSPGALDAAGRAAAAAPRSPAARRASALAFLRAGRLDDAEREAAAGLGLDPAYPEGTAALALVRMMQGRLVEADRLFAAALAAKDSMAEALGNHAALYARLGREAEAMRLAARAVRLKPFLTGPLTLLGSLLHKAGRPDEAAAAFAASVALDPDQLPARINLADALRLAGRAREAVTVCLDGLDRRPRHPDLLVNLGAALQSLGEHDGAIAAYEQALATGSAQPAVDNNLARLHRDTGRPDLALARLRAAHARDPSEPDIAVNLAGLLLEAASADPALLAEAETAAGRAAAVPNRPDALAMLGRIRALAGRTADAEEAFVEALRLTPTDAELWLQAGTALLRAGERIRALGFLRRSVRLVPGNARAWVTFGAALRNLRFAEADNELRSDLLAALDQPAIEITHIGEAVLSVIVLTPGWRDLRVSRADPAAVRGALRRGAFDALARDPLLLAFLEAAVVADADVEADLTALRAALLAEAAEPFSPIPDAGPWPRLAAALAVQCFLNEYVFTETEAESANVATVLERLADVSSPGRLAVFAAYRPLHRQPRTESFAAEPRPEALASLFRRQFDEPRREARLETALPVLTPIGDSVSIAVRRQYEESPHPRWFNAGLLDRPLPVPAAMRALFPHVTIETGPWWSAPEILIAGCGTGREPVWAANQFEGARVLAVDLSRASLAYAARQTEDLGVESISYAQADLIELGALERTFDIIQSVGVLHHLADPLAGWRVLTGLLRPHGLMKIGLYSEIARRAIVAGRNLIAQSGFDPSPEGIRRFRQAVLALPENHPARSVVRSVDFYSASACRDLLFHVQEHRMTLPQIADWLDVLGLEFLGFQLEDQTTAHLYRARFPDDPAMRSLADWNRFENDHPMTFGALYQFWVRRKP